MRVGSEKSWLWDEQTGLRLLRDADLGCEGLAVSIVCGSVCLPSFVSWILPFAELRSVKPLPRGSTPRHTHRFTSPRGSGVHTACLYHICLLGSHQEKEEAEAWPTWPQCTHWRSSPLEPSSYC